MSLWRKGLTRGVISEEKSPAEEISGNNTALSHTEKAELDAVHTIQPGDLSLEEDVAGGLGRHLYVHFRACPCLALRGSCKHVPGAKGGPLHLPSPVLQLQFFLEQAILTPKSA